MHNSPRLILATQFYPPDTSTTAVYLGMIADTLAADNQVVVISATPNAEFAQRGPAQQSGRCRNQKLEPAQVRARATRGGGLPAGRADVLLGLETSHIQRRRLLRNVSFHVALHRASGGETARRGDAAPHLRSLSRSARSGRPDPTQVLCGSAHPLRQHAPVSKPGRHRRHRTGRAAPDPEVSRRQTRQRFTSSPIGP